MKKYFKPVYLAFYILILVSFFVVGMFYASLTGASEGKGLAGGAIILCYGLLFGFIAFIISILTARKINTKYLKIINWILLVGLMALWSIKYFEFRVKNNDISHSWNAKTPTKTLLKK